MIFMNCYKKGLFYTKKVVESPPTFGSVTLHFQDGRFSHLVRTETKK